MRERLQSELEATRASFQALLDSLSEGDFHKQSNNPGWTNGEILFHMTLGFILIPLLAPLIRFFGRVPDHYSRLFARFLNFGTTLFNWFNALGARIGGSIYTRQRIGGEFDRAYSQILRLLDSIGVDEWQLGMYYPTKWDPLFAEYMTLENLFHYPTRHFRFHLEQISVRNRSFGEGIIQKNGVRRGCTPPADTIFLGSYPFQVGELNGYFCAFRSSYRF
ncbi:MAG TPA: DinB family protein [Anaerolineales bacterium]|nr:DinB family protein [Anaerolineales bacterium]